MRLYSPWLENPVAVDDGDRGSYHPPFSTCRHRHCRGVLASRLGAGVRILPQRPGERVYQALYPDWTTSQARDVGAICQDDTATVWVAEQQGRPVGFVAARIDADSRTGEIYMLAVDPLVQRQGIGTALTSFAVQRLRDAGVGLAVVGTGGDLGHAPARRVYEKAGFVGLPLVRYYARLDTDAGHKPALSEGGGGPAPLIGP